MPEDEDIEVLIFKKNVMFDVMFLYIYSFILINKKNIVILKVYQDELFC